MTPRTSVRRASLAALLIVSPVRTVCAQAFAQAVAPDMRYRVSPATGNRENDVLPLVEITGFLTMLSIYDRIVYADQVQDGKKVYSSTFKSTWEHLRKQNWVYDQDPFNVNQFAHPYQGATMYGLARSTGHRFWPSLVYSNVGSFFWKMAGETDPPSINDMITTGQAGSLLGEVLYRMADLVRKDSPGARVDRRHEFAATMISPPTGVNRKLFGNRFTPSLSDSAPGTIWQIRAGATGDALARDYTSPGKVLRTDATVEFSMSYGLPGQTGYLYTRPLDYFDAQLSLLSRAANPIENVMVRGLLHGRETRPSESSRGIWGLYGSYDYISPYLFRVSSTALSVGTTRQRWVTERLALQGTMMGGVGYGAAGSTTIIPSTPTNAAIRDYHFGLTPQGLVALRFVAANRAMFDASTRGYYVTGLGSDDKQGAETIFRSNVGVTVRLVGGHALGAQAVSTTRDARYGELPNKKYREGTVTFTYTFLGGNRFNAVQQRDSTPPPAR